MRKPQGFFSLNRPKLRQSWNKHNLYNMARMVGREPPIRGTPTFFQQKWAAKSKTRAYHGEHIPEKKWVRLFSRRLLGAVDMPPEYLAQHDGSEQAKGRGSGLKSDNTHAEAYSKARKVAGQITGRRTPIKSLTNTLLEEQFSKMTPYMQMTFAPMERRLDTALFRAMFASSVRQARQFIIHKAVTVNGKKMVHPSYALNPGDMFQVDVEKVMFATGEQKSASQDKRVLENLEARKKRADALQSEFIANSAAGKAAAASAGSTEKAEGEAAEAAEGEGEAAAAETTEAPGLESLTPEESWRLNNRSLKVLLKDVRKLLKSTPQSLTAKDKKVLRLFRSDAKRYLSHPEGSDVNAKDMMDALKLQMESHESMRESFEGLSVSDNAAPRASKAEAAPAEKSQNKDRELGKGFAELSEEQKEKAVRIMGDSQLTREEMRSLARLLQSEEENPIDYTKPYATPWRPRAYMSAFAFIPRYLEVNQNICAAVYLRHPVARKGLAEVPTPFHYITSQLTHNWYLQRG